MPSPRSAAVGACLLLALAGLSATAPAARRPGAGVAGALRTAGAFPAAEVSGSTGPVETTRPVGTADPAETARPAGGTGAAGDWWILPAPSLAPRAEIEDVAVPAGDDIWVSGREHVAGWSPVHDRSTPVTRQRTWFGWRKADPLGYGDTQVRVELEAGNAADLWIASIEGPVLRAAHWDGWNWRRRDPPDRAGRQTLAGLAVRDSHAWMSVSDEDGRTSRLYHGTGLDGWGGWTEHEPPGFRVRLLGAGPGGELWAYGTQTGDAESPARLAYWDGWSWHGMPLPPPAFRPEAISVRWAAEVWMAGSEAPQDGSDRVGALFHWDGRAWGRAELPEGVGPLTDVVAIGSHEFWATGMDAADPARPLILQWILGTWERAPVPEPPGANRVEMRELVVVPGTSILVAAGHSDRAPVIVTNARAPGTGGLVEAPARPRRTDAAHVPAMRGIHW
ncbi:hypothetical protein [Planomonospora venezuelensis]|uniref:Secreted protein n=1 Tax=Planomonospora venezuelensis TaxID=1999 RepID=A0A841CYK7_PLAVE|nr:hypothetical protein [Planomonospora venezuelensis]MBB5963462.1 hypothetical protein [Planomonospora venezuelensis]